MNGPLDIHPKVAGASSAGAAAVIIEWLLSLKGITVPDAVDGAIVVLLVFAGGWLTPSKKATASER